MANKQIWEKIALAYYKEPEERTTGEHYLSVSGLCYAYRLTCPFYGKRWLMEYYWTHNHNPHKYWMPIRKNNIYIKYSREHDMLRGDFATLMSCLTDEEFEGLCYD